jgi:Ca-activated chloride channel family protein
VLLVPVLLLPFQPRVTGVLRIAVPGPSAHVARTSVRRGVAWMPSALRIVGLCLVVVALARPRLSYERTVVTSEGLDIMLAVDTSGSMRAEDMTSGLRTVNRLQVAKAVMSEFVASRTHDRIGVVVFGEEAFTHVPLTLDHDTLQATLEAVQIGVAGEGATAVGSAIAVGAKRLKDLEAPSKILVLLTDGRSNAGRFTPQEAAQLATALGVKVYTIGIGGGRRSLFGMLDDGPDAATLEEVAAITGGRAFLASDVKALQEVYATIDELEPSPAEVEEIAEHTELFRRFLVPGLAFLVLQALLSATWLRRLP